MVEWNERSGTELFAHAFRQLLLAASPSPPLHALQKCDIFLFQFNFERRECKLSEKGEPKIFNNNCFRQHKLIRYVCVQLESHPMNVLMRKRAKRCMRARKTKKRFRGRYLICTCIRMCSDLRRQCRMNIRLIFFFFSISQCGNVDGKKICSSTLGKDIALYGNIAEATEMLIVWWHTGQHICHTYTIYAYSYLLVSNKGSVWIWANICRCFFPNSGLHVLRHSTLNGENANGNKCIY